MRTRLFALGAASTLALFVTACGGGGSSHSVTPAAPANNSASAPNPNQQIFNTTGPTSKVTVSFKLPKAAPVSTTTRARLKKLYGHKNLRTLGNTSPTAQIRAVGVQQASYARASELSTGRKPAFVSGTTFWVELIITDSSNNILSDGVNECDNVNSGTCTTQFDAPIGTNLTASILLYDSCPYLLGAGATAGINVTTGANAPLGVTVNPVVSFLDVEPSLNFINDPSQGGAFNVTVTPLDADFNAESSPGILLNSQLAQVTGYTLTPQTVINGSTTTPTAITPIGGSSISPDPTTLVATQSYTFSGAGVDPVEQWNVSTNAPGSSVLPFPVFFASSPGCCDGPTVPTNPGSFTGVNSGTTQVFQVAPGLAWTSTDGGIVPGDTATFNAAGALGVFTSEFPTLQANTATYFLQDNVPGFSGNITISDNGNCGSVVTGVTPTEGVPQAFPTAPPVSVSVAPSAAGGGCAILATDGSSTASLNLFFNTTNLTIQSTARKH